MGKQKRPFFRRQGLYVSFFESLKKPCSKENMRLSFNLISFWSVCVICVVGKAEEYVEEAATSVKFQRSVTLPGCSSPLSLLGTGQFRPYLHSSASKFSFLYFL